MSARRFGALDLGFAGAYAYLGFVLAPSRSMGFQVALGVVVALLGAAGLALVITGENGRWPRALGIAASSVLLAFAFGCIGLLVASCAFLFGIYGALGKGIGILSIVAAALVLELCGLLPLFQLSFHLRRPAAGSAASPAR